MNRLAKALGLALALAGAWPALAQDDGPRVYQLVPEGARNFTAFAVAKRGNETPEPGSVSPGADIDTDILVLRYVQTFDLAGRAFSPFAIFPVGEVRTTGAPASSGIGDAQIGATFGLTGAPALLPDQFAAFKPGIGMSLLGRVFLPTGAYSAAKPVNLGSNRLAYQIGLPMVFAAGQSYSDPRLTSLEVLPTLTFYQHNDDPFGAHESAKDVLFSLEAHLTHNLSRRAWLSGDMLYRKGGETKTDGLADGNGMSGWSAGASAAFPLTTRATVILTYEQVVARNDNGPDGWFFRTALVAPF